jgi:tetratricopeptide (TPR) repeat protein
MTVCKGVSDGYQHSSDWCGGRVPDSVFAAPPQPAEPRRLAAGPGRFRVHLVVWCTLALAGSACAARHDGFSQKFVKPGNPKVSYEADVATASRPNLHESMRKVRALQSKTRKSQSLQPTIEQSDPALSNAMLRLAFADTAENHRLAAVAYRQAGVADYAYKHYQRALKLEPCDSLAFEGLAQIWRDWGAADLGLTDAYRAVHCRPESASAHNTLGTLFVALRQMGHAREAFERAAGLDDHAAFAFNNLCYVWLQQSAGRAAKQACERAIAIDPAMTSARDNLALAYVMEGNVQEAERRLLENPDAVMGHFSVGMLRMSLGRYAAAAEEFDVVLSARPSSREAQRRAVEAHARMIARREP